MIVSLLISTQISQSKLKFVSSGIVLFDAVFIQFCLLYMKIHAVYDRGLMIMKAISSFQANWKILKIVWFLIFFRMVALIFFSFFFYIMTIYRWKPPNLLKNIKITLILVDNINLIIFFSFYQFWPPRMWLQQKTCVQVVGKIAKLYEVKQFQTQKINRKMKMCSIIISKLLHWKSRFWS